jgi:glycerol-3-phosphate dehydrogenase
MWHRNWREPIWSNLAQPWDLIVIGGGITGAGILREASRAGLKTLLVEGHDFASGTSSRSSKMVHGGLRYLRNAQIRLTVDSVHERERLLCEGRGLIEPLSFLLAGYRGDRPPAWVFGMGLMVYDVLGRRWAHHHYDAPQLQELCPHLTGRDLTGGYQYHDAQTDDARLVLRVIREAVRDGGTALNYACVEGLLRDRTAIARQGLHPRRR